MKLSAVMLQQKVEELVSTGLSKAGLEALEGHDDCFRPYGSSKVSANRTFQPQADYVSPRVVVVGFFDGIGGLIVALSRLPVTIIGFVSCDKDEHTRRLMRRRWPGLIK